MQPRWHEIDGSRVLIDWMEHARSLVPLDDSLHEALNFGLARAVRLDTFACIDAPARGGLGVDVALRESPPTPWTTS